MRSPIEAVGAGVENGAVGCGKLVAGAATGSGARGVGAGAGTATSGAG